MANDGPSDSGPVVRFVCSLGFGEKVNPGRKMANDGPSDSGPVVRSALSLWDNRAARRLRTR